MIESYESPNNQNNTQNLIVSDTLSNPMNAPGPSSSTPYRYEILNTQGHQKEEAPDTEDDSRRF